MNKQEVVPIEQRFWSKVVCGMTPQECWTWQAAKTKNGYGKMLVEGHFKSAHRIAYELVSGAIPEGMFVLHGPCNNRACVNPAHLRLGTQSDNMRDMVSAGHGGPPRMQGIRHWKAKLTEEQVLAIRENPYSFTQREAARFFGISQNQVSLIQMGKAWKHLSPSRE